MSRRKGYTAALLATAAMGSLGVIVRQTTVSATGITGARMGFGFVFFLLYLGLSGQWRQIRMRPTWPMLLSGLLIPLIIMAYVHAIQHSPLAIAAVLLYTGPPLAVTFSRFLFKETLRLLNGFLLVMAFSGLLFLVGFSADDFLSPGTYSGLLAGLLYGFYITSNRAIAASVPDAARSFYQFLVGSLTVLPFIILSPPEIQGIDWCWLLFIGLSTGFFAIILMVYALKRLPAQEYGLISYLEPLIGALWGLTLFSESLSRRQLIGGALILISGLLPVFLRRGETRAKGLRKVICGRHGD